MKERPVLFNSEMVRAILNESKTQTRRPVKPQPNFCENPVWVYGGGYAGECWYVSEEDYPEEGSADYKCPFGKIGDRLWVRETFSEWDDGIVYRASNPNCDGVTKWKPSIHMPKSASRINLEITNIRVERVQKISGNDAIEEGVCSDLLYRKRNHFPDIESGAINTFRGLWDSIYENWNDNPRVWVAEFKRI